MKGEKSRYRLDRGAPGRMRSPFGTLIAGIIGAVLLVLAFMFSLLILAGVIIVAVSVYGYLWWKTRSLRKHLREQMRSQPSGAPGTGARSDDTAEGNIIEGVVVHEERETSAGKDTKE